MSHLIGRHPELGSHLARRQFSVEAFFSSDTLPFRPAQAGLELGATIAAFEATDFDRLDKFFDALSTPIDHVLITSPGP